MALSYKKLFPPTLLTATVAVIFTMPDKPATTVVKNLRVRLTNTSALAVAVTLHHVPDGDSPSVTNMFLPATSIAPTGVLEVDVPTMDILDTLQGFAGTTGVINIQEVGGVLYS